MTQQDIRNAKDSIFQYFTERGGLPELFEGFMATLLQSNDFGLNEVYVTTPVELAGQWFNDSHMGKESRPKLVDQLAEFRERRGDGDKNWSILDKRWI
jgi:hypothetical protein